MLCWPLPAPYEEMNSDLFASFQQLLGAKSCSRCVGETQQSKCSASLWHVLRLLQPSPPKSYLNCNVGKPVSLVFTVIKCISRIGLTFGSSQPFCLFHLPFSGKFCCGGLAMEHGIYWLLWMSELKMFQGAFSALLKNWSSSQWNISNLKEKKIPLAYDVCITCDHI